MMDMPVQAGKRLQDLVVAWHEKQDRADVRQQHADLRRRRMSCADSLRPVQQTQDWTRSVEMSPSGRFQVLEEKAHQAVFTRQTVRWDAAVAILIAVAVLLGAVLLAELAGIGISSRNISRLDEKISYISQKNEELNVQLLSSTGDITVCTEAVKLNLIASGGAKTIALQAPANANMIFTGVGD